MTRSERRWQIGAFALLVSAVLPIPPAAADPAYTRVEETVTGSS